MTNPTPQELIQRLTGALDELRDLIPAIKDGSYEPDSFTLQPLESAIQDVSIALAQPEPQGKGVTFNQKIDEIWCQAGGDIEACPLTRIAFAEAIITRYARPTTEPVPVTERPWEWEGWCDAEGRCWFGTPKKYPADAGWILREPEELLARHAVSLPHHALPVPGAEVQS